MKIYVHWHPRLNHFIVVQSNYPHQDDGRLWTNNSRYEYAFYSVDDNKEIYEFLIKYLPSKDKLFQTQLEI